MLTLSASLDIFLEAHIILWKLPSLKAQLTYAPVPQITKGHEKPFVPI